MTLETFPHDISHLPNAEKTVLGWLFDQVDVPDVQVFCNVEWLDGLERREIDLLVSIRGVGLCILEVKGGPVDTLGNQWRQWSKAEQKMIPRNFVDQIDQERRILRDILTGGERKPTPKIGYLLVTPDSEFEINATLPGMNRNVLVSRNDRNELWDRIHYSIDLNYSQIAFDALKQLEVQMMLTTREETYEDIVTGTKLHALTVDQLSLEQSFIMEMMQENQRVLVSGGPGSGKTIVAIEEACRMAQRGQRVALLCYNRGLAALLNHKLEHLGPQLKPHVIGTVLDGLRRFVELPEETEFESGKDIGRYFENDLPVAIIEKLRAMNPEEKFDAIVVDEMQDFTPLMWELATSALRDLDTGRIIAFGDKEQTLTKIGSDPEFHAAKVRLNRNLRSTNLIAQSLNEFYQQDMLPSGVITGVTPEMHVIEDGVDVHEAVDAYIEQLCADFHWKRGDIAVLATHHTSPKHKADLEELGVNGYWESLFNGTDVFYSHVNSFKGLERPLIIVAIQGFSQSADALRQLFVCASRARDDLVFFGTQTDLEKLGNVRDSLLRVE